MVPGQSTDNRLAELSAFQLRVLRLMATGLSNTAIAVQLGISRRAVENHVSRLLHALGLVQDDAIAVRVCAVLIYLMQSNGLKHADGLNLAESLKLASHPKRADNGGQGEDTNCHANGQTNGQTNGHANGQTNGHANGAVHAGAGASSGASPSANGHPDPTRRAVAGPARTESSRVP